MAVKLKADIPELFVTAADWQWGEQAGREVCPSMRTAVKPGDWALTDLAYSESAGFWSFSLVKWAQSYSGLISGLYAKTGGSSQNPQGDYSHVAGHSEGTRCVAVLRPKLDVRPGTGNTYKCVEELPDGTEVDLGEWAKAPTGAIHVWTPEWLGSGYPLPVAVGPLQREPGTWTLRLEAWVFGASRVAYYTGGNSAADPKGVYTLVRDRSADVDTEQIELI
jgi:hypothetical protein